MQVMSTALLLALLGSVRFGTEATHANANTNQGGQQIEPAPSPPNSSWNVEQEAHATDVHSFVRLRPVLRAKTVRIDSLNISC